MELTDQQKKSQEVTQTIISKAWDDESFKEALIANPAEAIKEATGETVKLPEGKTLVVKDQTDESVIYLNIPAEPNFDDMELNDEQLEAVAGGNLPPWIIPTLPV
jgi:hypothetical protein